MFQAVGHKLEGDHLDLSFHNTTSWTKAGPDIAIKNQFFCVGDGEAGPTIMLGMPPDGGQDMWLDTHYHGSDQFRVVIKGEFLLQKHRMRAGDFGYQESGRTYREGLAGGAGECWYVNMHGTWRGARGTRTRTDGSFELPELADHQLDRFAGLDDPCWNGVPGGPKGIAALNTTLGPNRAGYAWGSFDDTKDWRPLVENVVAMAGVFGLPHAGPILFTLHASPNCVTMPVASYGTEVVCIVIRGSVEIGGKCYGAGELRVQKAGVALDPVVSGPDGLDLIFLVSDRRERPQIVEVNSFSQCWKDAIDRLYSELSST